MLTRQQGILTAEGLIRLPRGRERHELVRGELRTMPLNSALHGTTTGSLVAAIGEHARSYALGHALLGTGFILARHPDTVRAADVSFVAHGRFPGDRAPTFYPELAPDLAVEVVDGWDAAEDLQERVLDWLRAGVRLVWVVHPSMGSVSVYRSLRDIRVLAEADEIDGADVLRGFSCPVRDAFPTWNPIDGPADLP